MPHCVIEYAQSLESDINRIIAAVVAAATDSALFDPQDIKARAIAYDHFDLPDATSLFIHVNLHILSGRSVRQRQQLSDCVLTALNDLALSDTILTVQVAEIERETYVKYAPEKKHTLTDCDISTEAQLRALYGYAKGRAKEKELDCLEEHSKNFIQLSPFVLISTVNREGQLDCSPRGGKAGFVQIIDAQTLVIADSRGNNRLDSLVNIVETGQIACLFLIPGVDETLRINGRARISTDAALLAQTKDDRNPAKSVIIVSIEQLYMHCAKAMMRSTLWAADSLVDRAILPTMAQIVSDQIGEKDPVLESQAQMVARYNEQL